MKKWTNYIVIFVGVFAISFSVLYFLDLVPKNFKAPQDDTLIDLIQKENPIQTNELENGMTPDRITIPVAGVDSVILKPQSQNVVTLDQALTKGAVYYPGSGFIEKGNVLLFGHSTNWQVVQNDAYKTFNGLDKLNSGDEIFLQSGSRKFIYKVRKVSLLNENQAEIKLNTDEQILTLSTCNTFGAKQERWVVEAVFDREV